MRFVGSLLLTLLVASPALADRQSGHSGPLGQVSRGIDRSDDSPPKSSASSDSSSSDSSSQPSSEGCCVATGSGGYATEPAWTWPRVRIGFEGFAGAQKVHDSDGSLSASGSILFSRVVRINADISHYYEDQEATPKMSGGKVTLTMPSATADVRVAHFFWTELWLGGGITHISTRDPYGNSSVTGTVVEARVRHKFTPSIYFVGSAGAMMFDAFHAYTGRVGVRFNHVEAAIRVLDFSVGPALYGPEIGIGF